MLMSCARLGWLTAKFRVYAEYVAHLGWQTAEAELG